MPKLLRAVQLDNEQYSRFVGVLEADNPKSIALVLKNLAQQLAIDKDKAWTEMERLASVDRENEFIELSHVAKQILVWERVNNVSKENNCEKTLMNSDEINKIINVIVQVSDELGGENNRLGALLIEASRKLCDTIRAD